MMAHEIPPPLPPNASGPSKKRKHPSVSAPTKASAPHKKPKLDHRARQRDARVLDSQTSGKAFPSGSLDVDQFVRAREFEVHALEDGLRRSGKALRKRAFQLVPPELRRRTASHNVKRVPKRLRARSKREMIEDNTPTVSARRRTPSKHMRLRLETVKKLRALGAKKKKTKNGRDDEPKITVRRTDEDAMADEPSTTANAIGELPKATVQSRNPRIKKATLAKPPVPKAKFRKRQIHKSWLPTHLFHTKRAHMTMPSAPMWRFAIPLTPTQKSYRPTHRASTERGVVAWDMSYFATIGLEGQQKSIQGMLKALRVGTTMEHGTAWTAKGDKWRNGNRALHTFLYEREAPYHPIAPVTIIWCVPPTPSEVGKLVEADQRIRKLFIRVQPSAFSQLWNEIVRLAKVAKPGVSVEDLRFEIGSIDLTGPGSTEALIGTLWPSDSDCAHGNDGCTTRSHTEGRVEDVFPSLAGITNPAMLPAGAVLGFGVQDPRLHHPPRRIALPKTDTERMKLLETIAQWTADSTQTPPAIFDRRARLRGSKLPSQKAINRRKSLAGPGEYPPGLQSDPSIPILLYTTVTANNKQQATWTLLAPWKCIQPIWYNIIYYPLSTGQQPRFGGLKEIQQLAFERNIPWFPADYPGTDAGWAWEVQERAKRWGDWQRRPKGKRTQWNKVALGDGRKGEIGEGWACDWSYFFHDQSKESSEKSAMSGAVEGAQKKHDEEPNAARAKEEAVNTAAAPPQKPDGLTHLPSAQVSRLLTSPPATCPDSLPNGSSTLITVRIAIAIRGVAQTCARIYRLPQSSTNAKLRNAWLALRTQKPRGPHSKHSLPRPPKDAPRHVLQRHLAQALLEPPRPGDREYPACPPEEDLIGFVTTGSFNLAEGRGAAIGSLLLAKVLGWDRSEARDENEEVERWCVVRNAGQDVGRLARWEVA